MAAITADVPKTSSAQDAGITPAPKVTLAKPQDCYITIAPKSASGTTGSKSLPNTPKQSSPKIHHLTTHSKRSLVASEGTEFHLKHRKSHKSNNKTSRNNRLLRSESFDSTTIGKMSLASARWDGYVHIAPKEAATTKSQPLLATSSSTVSPNSPLNCHKPYVFRSQSTLSSDPNEPEIKFRECSELSKSPVVNDCHIKNRIPISDNLGAITPAFLARYHLPGILIKHGPLAIRHIMSFLTSAVPGFSRISPAKSRRLVVSALERRTSEGIKGERECSVTFEKVGWGRWNARLNGRSGSGNKTTTCPNSPSSCKSDSQIAKKSVWSYEETRLKASGTSLHDDSISYSHGDHMDIDMNTNMTIGQIERDRISFDSQEIYSSQESIDEDELISDNSSDTTDDEDWAALGAAALRAASYSKLSNTTKYFSSQALVNDYQGNPELRLSTLLKSNPKRPSKSNQNHNIHHMTPNSQEREAVEALMHLGAV